MEGKKCHIWLLCLAEYSTLQRMSGTYIILVQWKKQEVYNGDDTCDKYNVVKFMSWTDIFLIIFIQKENEKWTDKLYDEAFDKWY